MCVVCACLFRVLFMYSHFFLFHLFFCCFVLWYACFPVRDKKEGMDLGGLGDGEHLRGAGEEEMMIRIYCMKK